VKKEIKLTGALLNQQVGQKRLPSSPGRIGALLEIGLGLRRTAVEVGGL